MNANNNVIDKFDKISLENRDRLNNSIFQSKRTKLHENRREINDKISKELRMKSGAKNLIELTKDKKLKNKINIEIDYFDSNLKLWKEELDRVNCALDTYQNMKSTLPMVPVAMKNTIDIDFKNAFRNMISVHYCEDPDQYQEAIDLFNERRKVLLCPQRNLEGTEDHISYYNYVNNIERRFFFPDRSNGIIFSWNDIFTGVPFQQRTVIFEKSGVVFNLAALFSQLAAATNKTTKTGLEEAQTYFLKSESCFNHLNTNFLNAPSVDLKPEILLMLSALMRAQSVECRFLLRKMEEMSVARQANLGIIGLVSECLYVSNLFDNVYGCLHIKLLHYLEHLPQTWINLVQIKANYYKAYSYQMLADRFIDITESNDDKKNEVIEEFGKDLRTIIRPMKYQIQLPTNQTEAIGFAKLFINESLLLLEESVKMASMNSYLRNFDDFTSFLQCEHNKGLSKLHQLNSLESYDLLSCPELYVQIRNDLYGQISFQQIIAENSDFDIFKNLGPIETFNSRCKISGVRTLTILKDQTSGFGFTVKGEAPMKIVFVEKNSNSDKSGLKIGNIILAVDGHDLKWSSQEALAEYSSNSLSIDLRVATITECALSRNNTTCISPLDQSISSLSHMDSLSLSLSLPSKSSGKVTWKQRLSDTWNRKKTKSSQHQSVSTLF